MNSPGSIFEDFRTAVLESVLAGESAREFSWPVLGEFNWALDWFDEYALGNEQSALVWYGTEGVRKSISYAELRERSDRAAAWLVRHGVGPGSPVLVSLRSGAALWEIMLAIVKLNAIIVPVPADASSDRIMEAAVLSGSTVIIATPELAQETSLSPPWVGITAGGQVPGWVPYEEAYSRSIAFRSGRRPDVTAPMIIDCSTGPEKSEGGAILPYSGYASTVGRVADLHFTRLAPGTGYVSIAAAGSIDYLLYTFLGPLVAGVAVVSLDPAEIPGLEPILAAESIRSVYACPECADAVSGAAGEADLFTSAPVNHPTIRGFLGPGEPSLPDSLRWGVRHRQSTVAMTGTVRPGPRGSRVVQVLPGHEWEIVPSGVERTPLSGDVCVRLSNWPVPPRRTSGTATADGQRLATGLAGHLVSDGAVVLDAGRRMGRAS